MNWDYSLAQILGFVSLFLGISTFFQKSDRKLKILMLIFNINHMLHFVLLGAMVSAVTALLAVFRSAAAIYTSSKYITALFVILVLLTGLFVVKDIYDTLPLVGMIIGTCSMFLLKGVQLRIGFIFASLFWLANNIIVGSIGGTLLEIILFTVNISTIYRLSIQKKRTLAVELL